MSFCAQAASDAFPAIPPVYAVGNVLRSAVANAVDEAEKPVHELRVDRSLRPEPRSTPGCSG